MTATTPIDLSATITTPENIQFEYRIAGPFRRFPALLLDFAIRLSFFFGSILLLGLFGTVIPFSSGMTILFFLVAWFALDWFYGLFFEMTWNGQTPGKWLSQIRVLSVEGQPISAYQATVRNFLRSADFAPLVSLEIFFEGAPPMYWIPTFLVSLICMTVTKRFQRLGDLAAGTMVVVNRRTWVPPKIKLDDPRIVSLNEYVPANFRMSSTLAKAVALYMERRSRIPVARRHELAMLIARPLFHLFDFRSDTSPDLLLCTLYFREFVSKDLAATGLFGGMNTLNGAPPTRSISTSDAVSMMNTTAVAAPTLQPPLEIQSSVIPPPVLTSAPLPSNHPGINP